MQRPRLHAAARRAAPGGVRPQVLDLSGASRWGADFFVTLVAGRQRSILISFAMVKFQVPEREPYPQALVLGLVGRLIRFEETVCTSY